MIDSAQAKWQINKVTMIAGVIVVAGFFLCGVSWWFFLLVALGTFGPGVLREIGVLNDQDEFQREASYRAGYHAFLVAGVVTCSLVAWLRSGEREIQFPEEIATLVLAILWCTWFFSSLLDYWGPKKTAFRVLVGFGCVWLAFTIISNSGSEWNGWLALLLHPLLTIPFFVMAWLSQRWPRCCGFILLLASVFFVWFFGWYRPDRLLTGAVTCLLFVGPLFASGIALVTTKRDDEFNQD